MAVVVFVGGARVAIGQKPRKQAVLVLGPVRCRSLGLAACNRRKRAQRRRRRAEHFGDQCFAGRIDAAGGATTIQEQQFFLGAAFFQLV